VTDRAAVAAAVRTLDLSSATGVPGTGELAHAFPLPVEAGVLALLALVDVGGEGRPRARHAVPLVVSDGAWRVAVPGDGAWRALALAIAEGRGIPALVDAPPPDMPDHPSPPVAAALVCRAAPGFGETWDGGAPALADALERAPGGEPGATAILGERLAVRVFERVEPGLAPDLELTAFLAEEARFTGVPALAGWAEVVTRTEGAATVALLRGRDPEARPLDGLLRDRIADLALAPGAVSMEWATDVARDLGGMLAALHGALASPPGDAPDLAPREASRDEIHAWRATGRRALDGALVRLRAVDPAGARRYKDLAPAVAERIARFEALPSAPFVMRVHGNPGLEAILAGDDGSAQVVAFDGPAGATREARRRPDSPLRDVAAMLRSLDAVARAARAEAVRRNGAPLLHSALDPTAWHEHARYRFLAMYREGIRRAGAPFGVDPDLLDAFEVVAATEAIAGAPDAGAARSSLDALAALVG
jgi:predicted trehalose synthase